MRRLLLMVLLVLGAWSCARWAGDREAEAQRLIPLLGIEPGMTAAEIGAGSGEMTVTVARAVGEDGRIFSTELEQDKRDEILEAVAAAGLDNVTVIEAGETSSNLAPDCCDAVFLRRVYHHFTDASAINRSIHGALRPGGRLAVIDFEPRWYLPATGDREGHGVRRSSVERELREAGFEIEQVIEPWPGRAFCVIARKPVPPGG